MCRACETLRAAMSLTSLAVLCDEVISTATKRVAEALECAEHKAGCSAGTGTCTCGMDRLEEEIKS